MSAVTSNFLKLAFSAYKARTNLRDGFLATSHLLCYFQEVNIRKIGPVKGDGVFLLEVLLRPAHSTRALPNTVGAGTRDTNR